MALLLVLVEGRALFVQLPLGRAGTLGWGVTEEGEGFLL